MFLAPECFWRSAPPNFWTCIIKYTQIPIRWQSFRAIGRGNSENGKRKKNKHHEHFIRPPVTTVNGRPNYVKQQCCHKGSCINIINILCQREMGMHIPIKSTLRGFRLSNGSTYVRRSAAHSSCETRWLCRWPTDRTLDFFSQVWIVCAGIFRRTPDKTLENGKLNHYCTDKRISLGFPKTDRQTGELYSQLSHLLFTEVCKISRGSNIQRISKSLLLLKVTTHVWCMLEV